MLDLNIATFLYNKAITIYDTDSILKFDDKISSKLTFKPVNDKYNKFFIKLSDDIPSNIKDTSDTLFGTLNVDNEFLKVSTIREETDENNEKINVLYFPNICLFKTCTFATLQYIIAYIFNINITNVRYSLKLSDSDKNLCTNKYDMTTLTKRNKCKFHHELTEKNETNINVFKDTISIGDNDISIYISDNNDNKLNSYEDVFYKNYYQTAIYYRRLINNLKRQKIDKYNLHYNISQIVVSLIYFDDPAGHSNINITKLFNIHHVGYFSKIYIHSDELDSFQANSRPMQYVKVHNSTTNVYKGITSTYNTCALYWGLEIDKGIILQRIEVNSNMSINFVFNNIDSKNNYDVLVSKLKEWMDENMITVLKKIQLEECVYNTVFKVRNYIAIFSSISASANVNNITLSDIDGLNELLLQETCKLKFKTRTSIQLNGYGFYTLGSMYRMLYLNGVHEFLTNNIMYKDFLPTIHVGLNGSNDLTISISNCFSHEELLFTFAMILSGFNTLDNNSTAIKYSEMNLDNIRARSTKYGKNLLKILENIDPRLFGPRQIGKSTRSFSGLCQKHKQRAVPITKDEYEYLRTIVPDSVVNVKNQTYPEQRLYLFCPYDKFPFLNYHIFPNQLCIIRCTTKPSNKTQYNYCANALDAEHVSTIQNKYENQTITLYNPLITKGRKCRLPEELKLVLVDYVLLKINSELSIQEYCLNNYDKYPFIIRRNPYKETYSILTEYNGELDYILILQSELNNDYFIFLNNTNNFKPLLFSENEEIRKFFISNIRKTNSQYNFFNFLEKIFKSKLSQYYEKMIKEILETIVDIYDIKFVMHDNFIHGIIWNNTLYNTPKLFWMFEDFLEDSITTLTDVFNLVAAGIINFPLITHFDDKQIDTLYQDYTDKKIHMIKYYNTLLFVTPFDMSAKWNTKDIIVFDSNAMMVNYCNINIDKNYNINNSHIRSLNIQDVLTNYAYIFMMDYDYYDAESIMDRLKVLNVLTRNESNITYTDDKYETYVSWRNSKINRDEAESFIDDWAINTIYDNVKTIYTKLINELEFRVYKDEIIVPKIITS